MWQWKLDETGLKILNKHIVNGLVVISTKDYRIFGSNHDIKYKDWLLENGFIDHHAACITYLKEINMYENTTVFTELKNHGYLYSRVWLNNEPMYFVYAMTKEHARVDCGELEDFAKNICKQFMQESFYIQRPGETLMQIRATDLKHDYGSPSDINFDNFCTESASINEMRRRSSYGEVFLMPHIGKIQ